MKKCLNNFFLFIIIIIFATNNIFRILNDEHVYFNDVARKVILVSKDTKQNDSDRSTVSMKNYKSNIDAYKPNKKKSKNGKFIVFRKVLVVSVLLNQ